MSGGGGGGGTTQYNWNDDMANYWRPTLAQGQILSQTPYSQYPGQRIADINGDQQAAMQNIRLYAGDPTYGVQDPNRAQNAGIDQETKTLNGSYLNGDPYAVQVNQYSGMNSQPFQQTLQSGMDDITRNYKMATAPDTAAQYAMNGTIGGTDYNNAVASNQFGLAQQLQKYAAGMQNDQYNRSAGLQEQDLGRASGAFQNERNRMVQTLNPTQNEQNLALQRQNALLGVGDVNRSFNQDQLNLGYQNYQDAKQYPYTQMDFLTNLLSRAQGGIGSNVSTQTSGYAASPFSSILGGALLGSQFFGQ